MITILCLLIFLLGLTVSYCAIKTCTQAGYEGFWGCFWATIITSGVLLAVLGISYAFVKASP